MPVKRLNHAVLYVSDVATSHAFYAQVLGMEEVLSFPGGVFLRLPASENDHDLALFQLDAPPLPQRHLGLYHLAWEVETLRDLLTTRDTLSSLGALTGMGDHATTKALYAQDPDGIEFEVCWILPEPHFSTAHDTPHPPTAHLDLDAEVQRFGLDLPGRPTVRYPG